MDWYTALVGTVLYPDQERKADGHRMLSEFEIENLSL